MSLTDTRQTTRRRHGAVSRGREGHVAAYLPSVSSLPSARAGTRHLFTYLPSAALGKHLYLPSVILCRVFLFDARQKCVFAECPIKNTQQTYWHSANFVFPVVKAQSRHRRPPRALPSDALQQRRGEGARRLGFGSPPESPPESDAGAV